LQIPGPDPPATRLPDVGLARQTYGGQGWRADLAYGINRLI